MAGTCDICLSTTNKVTSVRNVIIDGSEVEQMNELLSYVLLQDFSVNKKCISSSTTIQQH